VPLASEACKPLGEPGKDRGRVVVRSHAATKAPVVLDGNRGDY